MDVRALAYGASGLQLDSYAEFEVEVPMTRASCLPYVISETGVEIAVSRGVPEAQIRGWCESTLRDVLDDTPRAVLFDAYVASVRR